MGPIGLIGLVIGMASSNKINKAIETLEDSKDANLIQLADDMVKMRDRLQGRYYMATFSSIFSGMCVDYALRNLWTTEGDEWCQGIRKHYRQQLQDYYGAYNWCDYDHDFTAVANATHLIRRTLEDPSLSEVLKKVVIVGKTFVNVNIVNDDPEYPVIVLYLEKSKDGN